MEYAQNEIMSGKVISICQVEKEIRATIIFNDYYQTQITLLNVSREVIQIVENNDYCCAVVKLDNGKYISMFDLLNFGAKSESNQDGTFTTNLHLLTSNSIIGDKPFYEESEFRSFRFEITEGYELIGMCPYDVNKNDIDLLMHKKIDIPIEIKKLVAETCIGKFTFLSQPTSKFDTRWLSFGFRSEIYFQSNTPLSVSDFHNVFGKITSFFEILSGEQITINRLNIQEGKSEFIGYCNHPISNLHLFENKSIDFSGYLRHILFKITDFTDVCSALNSWFDNSDKLNMANKAYQRILLDETMKIATINKFLATMQLVEGYMSAFTDETQMKAIFNAKKKDIIKSIDDKEYRKFMKRYCTYSGQTFKESLQAFTFEGILALQKNSETNSEHYNELLEKIKDARNIYTHSSNSNSPQFSEIELVEIAEIYKHLYRINILSRLGILPDQICKRFSYDRFFKGYLNHFFNIGLNSSGEVNGFDRMMRHFSQDNKQKTYV